MFEAIKERFTPPPKAQAVVRIGQVLLNDMQRCDLFRHASGMAYVTLFSLVPSLAVIFGLISLFTPFLGEDNMLLAEAKEFILANLAPGSREQIAQYIDRFMSNLDMRRIGLTGIAGLLVTLILLLRQIEIALNRIWLVQRPRNIVTRFVHFWTFLTLGTVLAGLAIGIISGFDLSTLNPFGNEPIERGRNLFRTITPSLMPLVFFTLIYKIVPNTQVRFRDAFLGALPATILFNLASSFYGYFAANFTSYQAIYGALAAIPVFLLWLYILWIIILLGAVLSWRAQQSFELDDRMDDQNPDLTAEEKLRNHQIQAALPLLCLLAIYEQFSRGDGKGVSGKDLALHLNVTTSWICDALEALVDLGLVVEKRSPDFEAGETDFLQAVYFPAYPPDKLVLSELKKQLSVASLKWVEEWHHSWQFDLKPILKKLWGSEHLSDANETIEGVLKALPAQT